MRIRRICLINLEYHDFNGWIFELLNIQYETENTSFDGSLLGLAIQYHVYLDLFFFRFEVKSPLNW